MKKKKNIGAFLRVPIDEKYHTYGRIISEGVYAFYDCKTDLEITDLETIEKSLVLFKVFVHNSAIRRGGWQIIGTKELPPELKEPVPFFIQEIGRPDICWIDINGVQTKATPSECIGLERFSVWEYQHIEERLLHYYQNVPDFNAERSKVKL